MKLVSCSVEQRIKWEQITHHRRLTKGVVHSDKRTIQMYTWPCPLWTPRTSDIIASRWCTNWHPKINNCTMSFTARINSSADSLIKKRLQTSFLPSTWLCGRLSKKSYSMTVQRIWNQNTQWICNNLPTWGNNFFCNSAPSGLLEKHQSRTV